MADLPPSGIEAGCQDEQREAAAACSAALRAGADQAQLWSVTDM